MISASEKDEFLLFLMQFSLELVHPVPEGLGLLIIHSKSLVHLATVLCDFTMTIHAHVQKEKHSMHHAIPTVSQVKH